MLSFPWLSFLARSARTKFRLVYNLLRKPMTSESPTLPMRATSAASHISSDSKIPHIRTLTSFTDSLSMRSSTVIRGIKHFVSRSLKSLSCRRDQGNAQSISQDHDGDGRVSEWTPFRVGTYLLSKKIGAGSFGSVHLCKHIETGKKYAGKLFDDVFVQRDSNMKMVLSEAAILKEVSHENTISFVDLIFSKRGVLLVMELVDGSGLSDFVSSDHGIVESFARVVFEQLLRAIQHLHDRRIVHRDIKIENVMLDRRGNVKLVDYGLAEKARENRFGLTVTGYCGTPTYYSPEQAQCEIDDGGNEDEFAGDKIDIWAAGILLYRIVSGKEPFLHESRYYLLCEISQNNALWNVDFSPELRDLLEKILRTDPTKRLSIEEILTHSWMKGEKFLSNTKKTFSSKSDRVRVNIDEGVPQTAKSCPAPVFVIRDGVHVAIRAASMVDLVDWREGSAETSVKHMTYISEWSGSADENASIYCHYEETTGLSKQKSKESHINVRPRKRCRSRLLSFIPSLVRRKPRGRQLTEEDIAQVW